MAARVAHTTGAGGALMACAAVAGGGAHGGRGGALMARVVARAAVAGCGWRLVVKFGAGVAEIALAARANSNLRWVLLDFAKIFAWRVKFEFGKFGAILQNLAILWHFLPFLLSNSNLA